MCIRDVRVGDRYAVFLHCRYIRERYRRRHAIKAGETNVTLRILYDVAVEVSQRSIRADDRRNVLVAEESIVSRVPARLIGQQVWLTRIGGGAGRVVLRAMNADSDKIGKRLT